MATVRATGAVRVRVPATSANLGPGFDCFGLALALHDAVEVVLAGPDGALEIEVEGEGADEVPRDGSHLVVRSLRRGWERWSAGRHQDGGQPPGVRMPRVRMPGVRLHCRNRLPHSRGLGSSAAAIVAGLVAARALLDDPAAVDDAEVLAVAGEMEGHPDNVAACLSGGFCVSWTEDGAARSVRLRPDPRVRPVVCVPAWPMSTEQARGLLPDKVPHGDAVFTASRAALLVAAIGQRPDLLVEATDDRLHQPYRAAAMRPTADLVQRLREAGTAAVVSGAGPTVLALVAGSDRAGAAAAAGGQGEDVAQAVRRVAGPDWAVTELDVDGRGAVTEYLEPDTRSPL